MDTLRVWSAALFIASYAAFGSRRRAPYAVGGLTVAWDALFVLVDAGMVVRMVRARRYWAAALVATSTALILYDYVYLLLWMDRHLMLVGAAVSSAPNL